MMRVAVVKRDIEVGGEPEDVEDIIEVLGGKLHGLNKPFYTVYLLVRVEGS